MPRPALRFVPTVEGGCHFFPRRWPSTFLFDHAKLVYSPVLTVLISKPVALIAMIFPNEKNRMRVKPLFVSDEAAQRSGGLPTLVPFR
jgi:hypothetical protein